MNPLWTPSAERVAQANATAFMDAVSKHTGQGMKSYEDVHAWSIQNVAEFWSFYADYAGYNFAKETKMPLEGTMPKNSWFIGAELNYARALLYPAKLEDDQQTALISLTETGYKSELSYNLLRREVARCAAALKREGLNRGDRVAAFACNVPEAVILLLACSSLGLVFSSCSPDFGFEAANARFKQIQPKLLFASGHYYYQGKRFDTFARIAALQESLKTDQVILLPYPGDDNLLSGYIAWHEWLAKEEALSFEPLPFDQPLYVLYSSGTTGLPKAFVHRAGGALLKHHSEQHIHCDIKPGDKVFYFSTCGWMMWNWLISALAQAASLVLYEGSPVYPKVETLWQLVEEQEFSFFGTSARYIHSLAARSFSPKSFANLSALKTLASTGSPLSPAGFRYVYSEIKQDVHLTSISGGTDIVGCFMMGVPIKPVYAGQIQAPALGVDLAAMDAEGKKLVGEPAELVCNQPLPSMPLRLWNDPDYARYKASYFSVFPDRWRHGDLIQITEQGGIIMMGRSDATLNPGGIRIGTAEIYKPLEAFPAVVEACAVGKKENHDEAIWLLLVLQTGLSLNDQLKKRIQDHIRQEASPRHVPKVIIQVSDLPRTRSGKLVEVAVSAIVNGLKVTNRETMANPQALDEITALLG